VQLDASPQGEGSIRAEIDRWALQEPDDLEAAAAQLIVLARAHPARAEVLLALSLAFERLGRSAPAAEALRRARFLEPGLARILHRSPVAPDGSNVGALRNALRELVGAETSVAADPLVADHVPDHRAAEPEVPSPKFERRLEKPIPAPVTPDQPQTRPHFYAVSRSPTAESESPTIQGFGLSEPARQTPLGPEPGSHPQQGPMDLPDGWTLSRIALELWVGRFAGWATPLVVANLVVAFVIPGSLPPLVQAFGWLGAFALAAPFTLRGMAREWDSQDEGGGQRRRISASLLWTPLSLLVVEGSALALLSLRLKIQGGELFALGMLVTLPLQALFAPAYMAWVTAEVGLGSGLKWVRAALSRRGLVYAGVMTVVAGAGGFLLGAIGWGFLVTLHLVDSDWIRAVIGVMMSLPESLLLALIAVVGRDAHCAFGTEVQNGELGEAG
jgi:hypothetical protein